MTDEKGNVCVHLHVPAMREDGGAVLLDLRYHSTEEPGTEQSFKAWVPLEVMDSLAAAAPEVLLEMRSRAGRDARMNATDPQQLVDTHDEILAFAFGEIVPNTSSILVDLRVRTKVAGQLTEGTRGGLLVHYGILQTILEPVAGILELMRETGADSSTLPPPSGPIPAWNAGPSMRALKSLTLAEGIGMRSVVAELGATLMVIEVRESLNPEAPVQTADYLVSYEVLRTLHESMVKVLRKMDSKGENTLPGASRSH